MSEGFNICVNSQTPLVQFLGSDRGGRTLADAKDGTELRRWKEGVDYRFSPGGVTRMVYPLLRASLKNGLLREAHWVALNPRGPRIVRLPGLTLHHTSLAGARLSGYGKTKESLWGAVHGTGDPRGRNELFWTDNFSEYTFYNRSTAELMVRLDQQHDFDLFYVHDFQQLPIGSMVGPAKPKIFRWHIPFDATTFPNEWRPLVRRCLNSYDVVVASCRRYLDGLREFGYRGSTELLYPYLDPAEYRSPPPDEVERVAARYGISPEDTVVLVVGRMDPMKGQDRAVEAVARLAPRFPRLKLLLVGNGSFSGARGGLGLSKSDSWHATLERRIAELDLGSRVVLTGYVDQPTLDALYERCRCTVLPSVLEGFGLVVVESWLHRRPALVSRGAGIAELFPAHWQDLLVDPADSADLATRLEGLLGASDERIGELGSEGFELSRACWVDRGVEAEGRLISRAVEA